MIEAIVFIGAIVVFLVSIRLQGALQDEASVDALRSVGVNATPKGGEGCATKLVLLLIVAAVITLAMAAAMDGVTR